MMKRDAKLVQRQRAEVRAAGGEILKFLGDGVLAVFLPPDGANVALVTPAALAAAREILGRVGALNATETAAGNPALSLNIALHARQHRDRGPPRLDGHRPRRE
jgi:class 3 adenylate cyclase